MSGLLGDPASVAALVADLRRHAAALESGAAAVARSKADAEEGWVGPVALGHRRRLDGCGSAVHRGAGQMTELAEALDRYGEALAEARAELARVSDEAQAAGLEVRDGQVLPAWGVRGEARPGADETTAAVQERLARRLARTTTLLERRRLALLQRAEAVTASLR